MKIKQAFITTLLIVITIFIHHQTLSLFGTSDMKAFVRASAVTAEYGLVKGYATYNLYYPPLSSFIIWTTGKLGHIQYNPTWLTDYPSVDEINTQHIPIKTSLSFFLILTTVIVFLYLKVSRQFSFSKSINQSLFVGLNIALIEITLVLGYIDIYFVPPLFLSIYFLSRDSDYLAGIWFAFTFLIKLIPVMLLPIYLFHYLFINLKNHQLKIQWNKLRAFIFGMVTISLPIIYVYNPIEITKIIVMSAYHGRYLSLNALNFPWILKNLFSPDNLASSMINLLLKLVFFIISGTALLRYVTGNRTMYRWLQVAIITTYSYFVFSTGAHENHLFTAFILSLALFLYTNNQFSRWLYSILTGFLFLNLFLFYQLGLNVPPTSISSLITNNQSILFLLKNFLAIGTTIHLFYIYTSFILNKTNYD